MNETARRIGKGIASTIGAAALLVIGFIQCGVLHGGVSNKWVPYQATDQSFTVQHPSNLAPHVKSQSGGTYVVFQAGDSVVSGTGRTLGLFNYQPTSNGLALIEAPAAGGDAAMWADFLRSELDRSPGYQETSYGATTFNGSSAYQLDFQSDEKAGSDTVRTRTHLVFVVLNDKIFMLGGFGPVGSYDQAITNRFVRSLHV
jgi:hypothetical protein